MRSLWGDLTRTAGAAPDGVRAGLDHVRGGGDDRAGAGGRDRGAGEPRRWRCWSAATLCSAGGIAFSLTPAPGAGAASRTTSSWLGPLSAAGMRALLAVLLAFGVAVGIVQVAVPAFADAHGSAATGGFLLAALSAGNLAGGLVYGGRSWPGTLARRLTVLLRCSAAASRCSRPRARRSCSPRCSRSRASCSRPPRSSARRCSTTSRRPARRPSRSRCW